jgi:hypothetical protein
MDSAAAMKLVLSDQDMAELDRAFPTEIVTSYELNPTLET